MGQLEVVMDAQVIGQQSALDQARREKVRKYAGDLGIKREITYTMGATNIVHLPTVLAVVPKISR